MNIDGACHCGQIQYRAEIDPEDVLICHCTDCQTLSGSAYRTVAPAKEGSFQLVTGKLKTYEKKADDGSIRIQSFCADCGTPIYSCPPLGTPGMLGIRVGSVTQRDKLIPKNQIWLRSSQPWAHDLSGTPAAEKQ